MFRGLPRPDQASANEPLVEHISAGRTGNQVLQ